MLNDSLGNGSLLVLLKRRDPKVHSSKWVCLEKIPAKICGIYYYRGYSTNISHAHTQQLSEGCVNRVVQVQMHISAIKGTKIFEVLYTVGNFLPANILGSDEG